MDFTIEVQAGLIKIGGESFEMPAGKHLRIETTPDGEEIANETVPAGKQWTVYATVSIEETDA